MRTLAIGDIHGRLYEFDALLNAVQARDEDQIVLLGDYIDRGIDSCGVIARAIELHESAGAVCLRGNHEKMMLDARHERDNYEAWMHFGGIATLQSYPEGTFASIPEPHWQFLKTACVDVYETDSYIFVHGHVDPHVPIKDQDRKRMRWLGIDDAQPHMSGKTVVCGHRPQITGHPLNLGHAICIDTAQRLTCLHVETGTYWQADESLTIHRHTLG